MAKNLVKPFARLYAVQPKLITVGSKETLKCFLMTLFIYKAQEREWSNNIPRWRGQEGNKPATECTFSQLRSLKAANLLLGCKEGGVVTAAVEALILNLSGHTVAVKTCSEASCKTIIFLTLIPFLHRMPPPFWPSVSASWASPERCNKARDG